MSDVHVYEQTGQGGCAKCRRPITHPDHRAALTRTRIVVVLDHDRSLEADDVLDDVLAVLGPGDLIVVEAVVLP